MDYIVKKFTVKINKSKIFEFNNSGISNCRINNEVKRGVFSEVNQFSKINLKISIYSSPVSKRFR